MTVDIYNDNISEASSIDFKLEQDGGAKKAMSKKHEKHEVVIIKTPTPSEKSHSDVEQEISSEEDQASEASVESVESEESVASEEDSDSDSLDTVECLSRDPLFLVLSQFLSNSDGNIVDALSNINKNLKKIVKLMSKNKSVCKQM